METDSATRANLEYLQTEIRRLGWLGRIRPQMLAVPLYRLLRAEPTRAIVSADGCRLYVDPFTQQGRLIASGVPYEDDTIAIIRDTLPKDGVFLDIGANEGIISAAAARDLTKDALLVAVEPQSQLRDILEINLALNASCPYRILRHAVTEKDGETVKLNLRPAYHNGGASIVNPYRWSRKTETISGISVDTIVKDIGRPVDLVKVDVEGYEPEVIRSALGSLRSGRLAALLVDYHQSILAKRGLRADDIDREIMALGYRREMGTPSEGYVLYKR